MTTLLTWLERYLLTQAFGRALSLVTVLVVARVSCSSGQTRVIHIQNPTSLHFIFIALYCNMQSRSDASK